MKRILISLLTLIAVLFSAAFAFCQEAPRIKKEDLKTMLRDPGVIILDVRLGEEWKRSDKKIAGAVREDPEQISSWLKKYPKDKTLIFYCS